MLYRQKYYITTDLLCAYVHMGHLSCVCAVSIFISCGGSKCTISLSHAQAITNQDLQKITHTSQLVLRMPQLWQQKDRQISQGVWRAHISALHDDTITIICNTSKQLILASCYIDKHFTMQTSSSVSREGCEVKKCAASEPSRINTFTTVILANTPTLHPENHAHVVCTYV